ncbi:MAG TPA: CPBP family glutamic-type intramembrane protease [Thermoanaerobaculia bacterium]|nr:CPBP family glutamic-type intramembrane protease [Thermoanaerobaculia bacterium]
MERIRLTSRDWTFIAVCAAVTLVSLFVISRWFADAFPEASIDFRYDRSESRVLAEMLLEQQDIDVRGMKHSVMFDADDSARIFLERSVGLEKARDLLRDDIRVWYWRHRWFRPLQEEEFRVEVAPTGEIVAMTRLIPESQPMDSIPAAAALRVAEQFLQRVGTPLSAVELVSQSERNLPLRVQRIFTWESRSVRPAGARYHHTITVDGTSVSSYAQGLRVPEEWLRSYRELRSKNNAAGNVDAVFMIITMIAALVVFIVRLRRGDMRVGFLLVIGGIAVVLVAGVTANSFPSAMASYDTTVSYPAFLARIVFFTILQSIGTAMLLIVVCGAGEVLYRERLPQHLAMPRLFNRRVFSSRRVFQSIILGYTLVGFFIAYQVAFYLIASKFGAWSPADVPYDDMLNTAIPWVAVMFFGFFPAFFEEFMSRAFSIPFFQRILRSRLAAIVLAGFIWGFGHSTYANQPFYIRGLEVGVAGIVLGFLMDRYGLLSLLIWHYTVDAVYTALLLFRSGNNYYIASAGLATAVFAIPLVVSIGSYIRNRGFLPDEELTNATLPIAPPPERAVASVVAELPPPRGITGRQVALCGAALVTAAVLLFVRPPSPGDVVDYRIDGDRAKEIAARHLAAIGMTRPARVAAAPVSGFRSWDSGSQREEGGAPGGFDDVAATYMVRNGMPVEQLVEVMRTRVQAATWTVRFFTPGVKVEYFVEVDPRTSRVIGYHKYADETAAGPRLERGAALPVAIREFPRYGVSADGFTLKDALEIPQPNRRDWLFHFEETRPLVAAAVRRVTVRVMGDEVTQFASTIKIPESVYRDAHQETILNVVAMLLKIAGIVAALALVVTGFILATRHGIGQWRRAARLTALLAVVPVAGALARYESSLFGYNTSVAWDTFLLDLTTGFVRTAGMQIAVLFVAVAGLAAAYPYAPAVLSPEGRRRFGQGAAVGAMTAIALFVTAREALRLIASRFRSLAAVDEIGIPDAVALPLPAAFEIAEAIFGAVLVAGAVALLSVTFGSWSKRAAPPIAVMAIVFCTLLDTEATWRELPLAIGAALLLAALVWFIAHHVLDGNPLAWPVTAFSASLLQSGASLAQNGRADLRFHSAVMIVVAVGAILWALSAQRRSESSGSVLSSG